MLSTIKLYFACLEEHSDAMSSDDREQYFKGIRLVDEACEDVRRISHDLASSDLVKFGLVTAIRQLGATIEGTGRLKVSVHAFAMEVRLASSVEINLYKIVQELINNILKHADASEVSIQLGRTKDELNIVVEDNGRGFDYNPDLQDTGLGLKSILLRVNKLHGQMQCDSVKKRGTITIITIPIKTAYYDKDYNS
jgi:signal transduction histidine kinase